MFNYKKHGIFLMICIGIIIFCSIFAFMMKEEEKDLEGDTIVAYLLNDSTLIEVPFVSYKESVEEKIWEIFSFMLQSRSDCTAIFYENTVIDTIEVKDGVVELSFSRMDYNLSYERKVLESIIYSCTQFEGVERVKLLLKEEELEYMPKGGLPLINMDRSFGINAIETNDLYHHEGNSALIYYMKEIANEKYYVPRSVRLKRSGDYKEILDLLLKNAVANTSLKQPLATHHVISEKDPYYEDGILHLYFNKNILKDKNTVYKECETILIKTFSMIDVIKHIQIHVNNKTYDVKVTKT